MNLLDFLDRMIFYKLRRQSDGKISGLIIINKPYGWPSMKVIRKIKKLTGVKKVGHAGTLDPLATGVLPVCIGREFTKKISELMNLKKEYIAEINLSAFSETDDSEGEIIPVEVKKSPAEKEIKKILESFLGIQTQIPPKYSAVRIEGKRAYKLAREKKIFELKAKEVTFHEIKLINFNWPNLKIKIVCSKGTYIRSLARDIGKKLGTGGYISNLLRTAVGKYKLEDAFDAETLSEIKPEMLVEFDQ